MINLSISTLLILTALGFCAWYFFDSMRARELATAVVREYCRQSSLQFLDGTVGLLSVKPIFGKGRVYLRRRYEFHYCDSDLTRNIGLVTLSGIEVENFLLPNQILYTENSSYNA